MTIVERVAVPTRPVRDPGGKTVALQHRPAAPYQWAQEALRVLEAVARRSTGVAATEIARRTGIGEERLTTLLRMLRREGYVVQALDGGYAPGESLTRLASAQGHDRALREKLQKQLERLRDTVGAAVYLSRYVDGEMRISQYAAGPTAPAVNEWVDFRSAAHACAAGKSLLGQLDHNGLRDHLARHKMPRLTSRTITSERLLLSRLEAQPPTVPVLDLQEYAVGTVCAAVPITAGATVGSLALSLPVHEAHRLRRAADALNRAAGPLLVSLAL